MAERRSALRPDGDSLAPYALASVLLHAGGALWLTLLASLAMRCQPEQPLIDPADTIEISMVSLPAPRYAAVARDAVRTTPDAATPPPSPDAAPPLPTPDAPTPVPSPDAPPIERPPEPTKPPPSESKEDERRRKELMAQLDMERLMDELADEGSKAQTAAGPAVDPKSTASRLIGPGTGDPNAARYIAELQRLFKEHFRPLPTVQGQGFTTVVFVTVDDYGRVASRRVEKSSGNASFDAAAVAAVDNVPMVPPPPLELRDGSPDTYRIPFSD